MRKWLAALIVVLVVLISVIYWRLTGDNPNALSDRLFALGFGLFPLAGALLIARHPRNPVGALLSWVGLSVLLGGTLMESAIGSLPQPTALQNFGAWLSIGLWLSVLPGVALIILLFPDGRFHHPLTRLLGRLVIIITLVVVVLALGVAWPERHRIAAYESGQLIPQQSSGILRAYALADGFDIFLAAVVVLAMIAFVVRYVRAGSIERQQLKWFVFGLSTIPASLLFDLAIAYFDLPMLWSISEVLNFISVAVFPVALAIAITRYRLYDIDFLIRRTLLYSVLTLLVSGIYFALVLLTQSLFTNRFGRQPVSVLVLTTLLVAAMIQPLRRRLQALIDRRFFRSSYNTEQALARFAARLRNEVDMDEIDQAFRDIVEESLQPEAVDLVLIKR